MVPGDQLPAKCFQAGMRMMVTGRVSRYIHFQMVHPMLTGCRRGEDPVKCIRYIRDFGYEAGLAQGLFARRFPGSLKT